MTTLSNIVVMVIISFLLIVLIYSSVTEVDIFAKPRKPTASYQCFKTSATAPDATSAETCCQFINGNPIGCSNCQYDANGNDVGSCENWTPKTGQPVMGNSTAPAGTLLPPSGNNTGGVTNGQTGPPPRLGTVLPTGNNTNTATPPPLTIIKEHKSTETSNNQLISGHHHKESGTSSSNPSTGSSSSSSGSSSSGGSTGSKSSSS